MTGATSYQYDMSEAQADTTGGCGMDFVDWAEPLAIWTILDSCGVLVLLEPILSFKHMLLVYSLSQGLPLPGSTLTILHQPMSREKQK